MTQILKVCFMVDCTLSMDKKMHHVKRKVKELICDLKDEYNDFKIYASLIGYRDFREQIHRVDFTENIFKFSLSVM